MEMPFLEINKIAKCTYFFIASDMLIYIVFNFSHRFIMYLFSCLRMNFSKVYKNKCNGQHQTFMMNIVSICKV